MSTEHRHSIGEEVKRGVEDVRDAASEALHHSAAEAEHERREAAGDTMTPGEKAASAMDEAKERIEEGVDKTKRSVRDHT